MEVLKAKRKSLNRQNEEMTLKPEIFGLFRVICIYRHHIEPRVQLYVQKEKRSLFHSNFLMSQGQPSQMWTFHQKNESTIIGMLMRIEDCQIRGQDSRNLLY